MTYQSLFSCPKCGSPDSTIFFLKVTGKKILIKKKCPKHGIKVIKVPFIDKDQYIHLIKSGVFRCFKCGEPSSVHTAKRSGPWTLAKMFCPKHKITRLLKIWTSIYDDASNASAPQPAQTAPPPVQQSVPPPPPPASQPVNVQVNVQPIMPESETNQLKKYCSHCGKQIDVERDLKFCPDCGSTIM